MADATVLVPFVSPENIDPRDGDEEFDDIVGDDGEADKYWIVIETMDEGLDAAGKGAVAEVIDTLYDIEPCSDEQPEADSEQEEGLPFSEEEFVEVVKEKLDPNFCKGGIDYYEAQVKVYVSHVGEPYTLRCTNGTIVSTVRTSVKETEKLTFNGDTKAALSSPSVSNVTTSVTPGMLRNEDTQTDISMVQKDGTLYFSEPVRGAASVEYSTTYDLVTVQVNNKPDGSPGECIVIGFYHGLVDDAEITPPDGLEESWSDRERYCGESTIRFGGTIDREDNVTCYENVTYQNRCTCSGGIANEWTEQVVVDCPENVQCLAPGSLGSDSVAEGDHYKCSKYMGSRTVFNDYVDCDIVLRDPMGVERARTSETSILADAEYYEEQCCLPPTAGLPNCQTKYSKNQGGKPIDPAKEAEYRAKWQDRVEFIGITPKDNDCGTTKTVINDAARSCCDFVTPIVIDSENSINTIGAYDSGLISFVGGRPPYKVSVRGSGFYLNLTGNLRDGIIPGNAFFLHTENGCGPCEISIDDGCSTTTHSVLCTVGRWVDIYALPNINYAPPGEYLNSIAFNCGIGQSTTYVTLYDEIKGKYAIAYGGNTPVAGRAFSMPYNEAWGPANGNCSYDPSFSDLYLITDPEVGLFDLRLSASGYKYGPYYINNWFGSVIKIWEWVC